MLNIDAKIAVSCLNCCLVGGLLVVFGVVAFVCKT